MSLFTLSPNCTWPAFLRLFCTLRHSLLLRSKQVDIKDSQNLHQPDTITYPISGEKKPIATIRLPTSSYPPGRIAGRRFHCCWLTARYLAKRSVLSGWPVLELTLLVALLSSIIIWWLVSRERVFPRLPVPASQIYSSGSRENIKQSKCKQDARDLGKRPLYLSPVPRVFCIIFYCTAPHCDLGD